MTAATIARVAFAALALVLLWRVLHVNAFVYADANRPVWRVPAEGPARLPALRAALDANPADARALTQYGVESDRAGDAATAKRAYASAIEIAPIDRSALRAGALLDLREGRIADAVKGFDRLVSIYPDTREMVFPLFARSLAQPEARAALEALAGGRASWMGAFVAFTCRDREVDPMLAAAVLGRRAAAGLAQREEVGCMTERLRRAGHWQAAYQVWLNSLPRDRLADVGFVFNGSFEHTPSGVGFDWIAEASPAHGVEYPVAAGTAGRRALRVTWSGKRVGGPAVRQYLALEPGRYELSGSARLETLQSVRGVHWALRCASGAATAPPLGVSARFLGSGDWQRFAFPVDVPSRCAGQVLQLEPVGLNEGTTYVAGKAWFDDLRLAHAN